MFTVCVSAVGLGGMRGEKPLCFVQSVKMMFKITWDGMSRLWPEDLGEWSVLVLDTQHRVPSSGPVPCGGPGPSPPGVQATLVQRRLNHSGPLACQEPFVLWPMASSLLSVQSNSFRGFREKQIIQVTAVGWLCLFSV